MDKRIYFLLFFLCFTIHLFSQNLYVSKTGNDTNPGTEALPFLTIDKAATVATAGTTVFIKEGTYEETLQPVNSGTAGSPIIFQSFPGDKVIISAMQNVNNFILDSGNIYKSTLGWNSGQRLFVIHDETVLDLARWPNNIDGDRFTIDSKRSAGGSDTNSQTTGHLLNNEIPNYAWQNGGSLWFYGDRPGSGWTSWKFPITASSSGRVDWQSTHNANTGWVVGFHPPADGGDFFLEGVKEALDFQNEWWFDENTNELFLQLPSGAAPVDNSVLVSRRENTININNKDHIEIRSLAVFGGSIKMNGDSNKLYEISSFYGGMTRGSAATGISSETGAINIGWSNPRHNGNIIEKCEIAFADGSGIIDRGANTMINNNYIHDVGYLGNYDGPIRSRDASNTTILNNTITRSGRDGMNLINVNSEVAYNDVSHSNLIADDCALFYYSGPSNAANAAANPRNISIHHNWFHDAQGRGDLKKAAGIYLDTNPNGFEVYNNVVWNVEWTAIQMNWNALNVNVYNNTFIQAQDGAMGAWHLNGTAFSNVNVWNNITDSVVTDNPNTQETESTWESQSDQQNNLIVNSSVFNNASGGDFTLTSGSSPIDAGRVIAGITDGFIGASPDAGAYEFGGDNWVAGVDWNLVDGPTGLGCYGIPSEACATCNQLAWYNDVDNDGLGDFNDSILSCTQPAGYIADATDACPTDELNTCTILHTTNAFIQAEEYTNQNGILRVNSNDANGAGMAIGYIENNDYSEYNTNVVSAGEYVLNIRVASGTSGGTITISTDASPSTAVVNVSNTGGFQSWTTLSTTINLTAGTQLLRLTYTGNTGYLLDVQWMELVSSTLTIADFSNTSKIQIYPNPTKDILNIKGLNTVREFEIIDLSGRLINTFTLDKNNSQINVTSLQNGLYFIVEEESGAVRKFIKE